jgi:hypothetical protein
MNGLEDTHGMSLVDDPRLTVDEQRLRDGISDISETCWYAGWLEESEFEVWRLSIEGGTWGRGSADELQAELRGLLALARQLNRWVVWAPSQNSDHEAVDLREWERRYVKWRSSRR